MAAAPTQQEPELGTPSRFITKYNAEGQGVFDTSIPDVLPTLSAGNLSMHLGYATKSFPVDLNKEADIDTYSSFLSTPPGIYIPGGTVLRVVDIKPGGETELHRTVSLDYGVVLEGEAELVLDSGESRVLKRGDISIQRGTSHLWRNNSKTEWGRMMFVSLDAKPVEVNGEVLNFGQGMQN
jgi:quercetin dioxygenase-like cupin family protein